MEIAGTIALSRMMALRQRMDVTANNIANMNTTGYKSLDLLLKEDQTSATARGLRPIDSRPVSMVDDWGTVQNMTPGVIRQTGNPLDVAIEGKGFFTITNEAGEERYTRNGVFQINQDGQLVDLTGNAVQGDGGELTIPPGTTQVTIGKDGTISTPTGTLGRLKVVEFANPTDLVPDGNNAFKAAEGAEPETPESPRVVQGSIEQSNVNGVAEMTEMVEVLRQYQSAQNIVQSEHDRLRNAIKSIARLA